ncbi:ribonuclease H-like domain-containing protein [Tanacetum coccineum]|uniref:Ribonuclease H-like domain-containing protein n=1 Tax=Tanacetum coccineum TaxID=301880 RepID=A0ABQ4XBS4_9ASTR
MSHALQDPYWRNAMYDEYNALVKNDTWLLVPRPAGVNMTFNSVVKNAFLYSDLSETVYMHQPPGFVDSWYPHHVFHFQRSLYGLKQAPRAWFECFAGYATRVGFSHSRCDSLLFIYTQGSQVAYLLIYVDDIILTTSSPVLLQEIIDSLHKEFGMTDLGPHNYFLGIFVARHSTCLFLSKKKSALQFLERAHMVHCNPSRTPVDIETKLGLDADLSLYARPKGPHFAALKRVMRYVKGTLDFGLHLYASATTSLVGYTDADSAGCPSARRSTSEPGDSVATIKRRRHDIHGDGVRDSVTASGRGRLKVDLEPSLWRRRQEYKATPSQRYLYAAISL